MPKESSKCLNFLKVGTFLNNITSIAGKPNHKNFYFLEVVNVLPTIASFAEKPNHVFSSCNSDFAGNT